MTPRDLRAEAEDHRARAAALSAIVGQRGASPLTLASCDAANQSRIAAEIALASFGKTQEQWLAVSAAFLATAALLAGRADA